MGTSGAFGVIRASVASASRASCMTHIWHMEDADSVDSAANIALHTPMTNSMAECSWQFHHPGRSKLQNALAAIRIVCPDNIHCSRAACRSLNLMAASGCCMMRNDAVMQCCNDASTAAGTGVRGAEVHLELPILSEEPAISQPTDLPSTQWASSHQNNRSLFQLPFPLNVQINARIQYT